VVEVSGGRLVFVAGQTALDRDGNLVGANNLEAQADQVFRNLGFALAAAGCTPRDLVKLNVFVRDMAGLPLSLRRATGFSAPSARRRCRRSRWSRCRSSRRWRRGDERIDEAPPPHPSPASGGGRRLRPARRQI
jgi:hypothetical protein